MRVSGHEDVIARIAAIPDNTSRLEAKMDRGFADLKEGLAPDALETATIRHRRVRAAVAV